MKVKVYVCDLKEGMYVSELDRPWIESPFLFQGFLIDESKQLATLNELCHYVYVDEEKSHNSVACNLLTSQPGASRPASTQFTETVNLKTGALEHEEFHEELRVARTYYNETRGFIEDALEDVRLGHSVDTQSARKLVATLADSVVRNYHALLWLTHLKSRDEYTTTHCINVCILALSFGRFIGLSSDDLNLVGLGALLHDLGKMRVPLEVLNKPGKLTKEEFEIMKSHPVHGFDMVKEKEGLQAPVLEIVRNHHERLDGAGYPDGLKEEQIGQLTRIVSIVDVYDAITSDRVYHDGMPPTDALKNMYNWAPNNFDQDLLEHFIRCIGIYPTGSLVELKTGHVGVIVKTNKDSRLKPVVLLVLNREKKFYKRRKLVNLASQKWQGEKHPPEITKVLESNAYDIDLRRIIEAECLESN